MRKKIFIFLLALAASVGMMNAKVTWDSSNMSNFDVSDTDQPYTLEGVTLRTNASLLMAYCDGNGDEIHFISYETGGFTFSNTLGKNFTKIEMFLTSSGGWGNANLGSGWSFMNNGPVTWTGNASTVDLLKDEDDFGGASVKIVFYFEGDSQEPEPEPAEDVNITPNADPQHANVYYSTFFDSSVKYELPAGVEAYVADLSGANLLLTKIAEAGEVIPANVAVILKSTVTPFTLAVSDADAVTFTATNDLQGSDASIATPDNCYVLSGTNTDGVGFYQYTGDNLNPHKAYVLFSGSNAPRRMRFVFNEEQVATGVENVQGNAQSTKVLENGQLVIIRNGVKYNAQGQIVK